MFLLLDVHKLGDEDVSLRALLLMLVMASSAKL